MANVNDIEFCVPNGANQTTNTMGGEDPSLAELRASWRIDTPVSGMCYQYAGRPKFILHSHASIDVRILLRIRQALKFQWISRAYQNLASNFVSSEKEAPDDDVVLDLQDAHSELLCPDLYRYASEGNLEGFKKTIKKLEEPNVDQYNAAHHLHVHLSKISPHKNTLVHIAVSFGHKNIATEIVKNQNCPNFLLKQNKEGNTAFHIAAKAGDLDMIRTLLRLAKEANIRKSTSCNSADEGGSSSTNIENGGTMSISSILRIKNEDEENTALHEALINGHHSVAEHLIECDALVSFCANKENKSPLYLAAEAGLLQIVELINRKTKVVKCSRNRPLKEDTVVVEGKSPWHAAVLGRNKDVLKKIACMGCTINLKDERGRSPLHCAASTGYLEGVRFLLGKFPYDSHQPNSKGVFPIHSASSKGYVRIVKELLQHCPESRELLNRSKGQNILHVAAKCGKDNVVNYLLKKSEFQLLKNHKDKDGNTPLHLATMYQHPKVLLLLTWDRRIKLNISNSLGMTALDVAESTTETIASLEGRLTWIELKAAGAKRAQPLHALLRNNRSQVSQKEGGIRSEGDGGQSHTFMSQSPNKESIRDRVNTLLVVTTLIATVTFAAGFTMPGGYNSFEHPRLQGKATLLHKDMFQVFVICDTIAMYSSILVAVTLIWAQLGDLSLVYTALRLAVPLLGLALTMLSLTFMAGVYVVISNLHWLSNFVLITGLVFLFTAMALFTPLFFPITTTFLVLRYITYYPLWLAALASGRHNEDLEED